MIKEINKNIENIDSIKEKVESLKDSIFKRKLKEIHNINKIETTFENQKNIPNMKDFYKDCDLKSQFNLIYSDDHPGSIRIMKHDIDVILKKKFYFYDINDELKNKILDLNLSYDIFNICIYESEFAPYYLINDLKKYEKINYTIAILDIIFGGVTLDKDNNFLFLDGIDVAKEILNKNSNSIIIFYTGCDLNMHSTEYQKLDSLLKKFPDNILVTDKDIDDNKRIEVLYKGFKKFKERLNNVT